MISQQPSYLPDDHPAQPAQPESDSTEVVTNCRPTRTSARKANARFAEWANTLLAPLEDVGN